jgi:hypothetical protein
VNELNELYPTAEELQRLARKRVAAVYERLTEKISASPVPDLLTARGKYG